MIEVPVDDLSADTGARCARCGSDRELTRPNSLVLDGRVFGEIVCEDCELASVELGRASTSR